MNVIEKQLEIIKKKKLSLLDFNEMENLKTEKILDFFVDAVEMIPLSKTEKIPKSVLRVYDGVVAGNINYNNIADSEKINFIRSED